MGWGSSALLLVGLVVGCGNHPRSAGGTGSGGSTLTSGASTGTGGSSGTSTASGGTGGTVAGTGGTVAGGPGCGLPSAAFCETFDAPSSHKGRAGELDSRRWAAGRLAPQLPTGNGVAIGIGPGTLPACRAGLPATVLPDQDTLVCDPSSAIHDNHLLVVAAAQNYGQNSYRIRQPFDFAGRTGTIVFDAQGFIQSPLLGWISLDVTEDPIDAPCFSIGDPGVNNNEGSLIPRNAFEVHFQNTCAGYAQPPTFSLSKIDVINEYVDTPMAPATPVCLSTLEGQLNRFKITVSQTKIEVYATSASIDGVTFDAPVLLYSADVALPFSRGYVQITTHNHATIKYSPNNSMDAWVARWDNVGFDGPVVSSFREYELPDALTPGMNAWNRSGPVVSMGYIVNDVAMGPAPPLTFHGVDITGVTSAKLSLSSWYLALGGTPSTYVLRYRLNGKAWHDRSFTAGELATFTSSHSQGQLGQIVEVPPSDLVAGDNTIEFVTVNVPTSYPPAIANVDLVLSTQ
jgi:hypothetical protein